MPYSWLKGPPSLPPKDQVVIYSNPEVQLKLLDCCLYQRPMLDLLTLKTHRWQMTMKMDVESHWSLLHLCYEKQNSKSVADTVAWFSTCISLSLPKSHYFSPFQWVWRDVSQAIVKANKIHNSLIWGLMNGMSGTTELTWQDTCQIPINAIVWRLKITEITLHKPRAKREF